MTAALPVRRRGDLRTSAKTDCFEPSPLDRPDYLRLLETTEKAAAKRKQGPLRQSGESTSLAEGASFPPCTSSRLTDAHPRQSAEPATLPDATLLLMLMPKVEYTAMLLGAKGVDIALVCFR